MYGTCPGTAARVSLRRDSPASAFHAFAAASVVFSHAFVTVAKIIMIITPNLVCRPCNIEGVGVVPGTQASVMCASRLLRAELPDIAIKYTGKLILSIVDKVRACYVSALDMLSVYVFVDC